MNYITTIDFLKLLFLRIDDVISIEVAKKKLIIDDYDIERLNYCITRKQAARIVHNYIKITLKEHDEKDINIATVLKDLYDCNVCVNHVAQVYIKGIMDYIIINGDYIFDMNRYISNDEANSIVERVYDIEKRIIRVDNVVYIETDNSYNKPVLIKSSYVRSNVFDDTILLIDLRNEAEYINDNICNSVNMRLIDIINSKYDILFKDKTIVIICNNGYQSLIAANYISDITNNKVMYCGLND